MRDERRAEFERALAENRSLMREISRAAAGESGSDEGEESNDNIIIDEEWGGITEPPPVDYEEEYIDEDKYTTVTVEELDASSRQGLRRRVDMESSDEGESGDDGETRNEVEEGGREDGGDTSRVKKRVWTKNKSKNTNRGGDGDKNNISDRPKSNSKKKKKKRSFRYENKAERRVAKLRERAGGKKRARERKAGA